MAGPMLTAAPAAATTPSSRSAVPSRPCPAAACSPRTTARGRPGRGPPATLEQLDVSSLHVTFCTAEEAAPAQAGFLVRRGVQYHWQNRGYADFAEFLDNLRSAKKKMVRKEREQVRASGIELRVLDTAPP